MIGNRQSTDRHHPVTDSTLIPTLFIQIHVPTGVTHSVCAYFTHPHSIPDPPNLIVVRTTLLEIFIVRGEKLELIDQYTLNGVVESLTVLHPGTKETQRDAILLTYREAKAAVLEWNGMSHSIAVSSLHCFEDSMKEKDGQMVFALGPEAKADPLGRCACVLFFGNLLALLPARDVEHLDVAQDDSATAAIPPAACVGGSCVLNLLTLGIQDITASKSSQILHGEKKDTRALTAISLNLKQKIYPVIWAVKHLPSDAYRLIAVPNGGTLVLSMNFITYYNQSQTFPVGVNIQAFGAESPQAVEAGAEMSTMVELVQKYATSIHPDSVPSVATAAIKGALLDVELDAAVWCWLNDVTMLMALKNGQLLLVQLNVDKDTVKDIAISKSGAAPIASCLSVIRENLLFIGSCQGDSLLVTVTASVSQEEGLEMELHVDETRPTEEELHDDDMMFFSGEKPAQSRVTQLQFTFSVVDSLMSIGPIRDIISGPPPQLDSGTQHSSLSPQLVACVGSGRSGALAVMRDGIVAEVLIQGTVTDIEAVWALKFRDESAYMPLSVTSYETDAYLLISTVSSTMILQAGEQLEEVSDKSDFEVGTKTVLAGSLFNDARIVQICPEKIRLLKGIALEQEMTLAAIISKHCTEDIPDEELMPVDAPTPTEQPAEVDMGPSEPEQPSSSVFYDFGLLSEDTLQGDYMNDDPLMGLDTKGMDLDSASDTLGIRHASICDPLILLILSDGRGLILEGDEEQKTLITLESAVDVLFKASDDSSPDISAGCLFADMNLWLSQGQTRSVYKTPVYCVICRTSGSLELYGLPEMDNICRFEAFPIGWHLFPSTSTENAQLPAMLKVTEIRMEAFSAGFGEEEQSLISRPVLFAMLEDGTLMGYSAFWNASQELMFRRLDMNYAGDAAWSQIRQDEKLLPLHRPRMVRFSDVGERHPVHGIFLCGMAPVFFIFSQKGMYIHRFLVDGSVAAMTPFSNVNCPKGFILATASGHLKICSLHNERLDCPWPCSKVPLRCTPHRITWYSDAQLYLILVSRPVPFKARLQEEEGGDTHASAAYAVNEQVAREKGTEESHEVRIIQPGSWSIAWTFSLQSNEVGLALKAVHLKNQREETMQSFIALGTATVIGEDYPSTGRILLFEIVNNDGGEWEGRIAWSQECRAPVGVVAVLDGSLLMGIGNRLELCAWTGKDMTRLAFFDAPIFITSANVMKSFVLFGDFLKGIHFIWYTIPTSGHDPNMEAKEMLLLGKDFHQADVFATEFLLNGTILRFISADGGKNVHIHGYHRDDPDSWSGRKLIPEGSFHVGHNLTRMLRMRLCSLDGTGRQAALYGTMEGSIGYVCSVWEPGMYNRLRQLQKLLTCHLPHSSGLNPSSFRNRSVNPTRVASCGFFGQGKRRVTDAVILDVDLIWRYLHLNRMEQESLAQRISGGYRHQLIDDLQHISLMTSFF